MLTNVAAAAAMVRTQGPIEMEIFFTLSSFTGHIRGENSLKVA